MDLGAELQRLSEADRHIANAERAVTNQILELEKLRRDGHDISVAERTLKIFQETLQVLREHRALIVRTIEQINQGLI